LKDGSLIVLEGQKRIMDEILTRKKLKDPIECKVSLKGQENIWFPCDYVIKRGFKKFCL
jgi:elongation factor 3